MAYTHKQAESIARQIYDRFGDQIKVACFGSVVTPAFLAGLLGVEAGKDRRGQLLPLATRFEPGVFSQLKKVQAGTLAKYNGITKQQITGASDESLRALSTSYGLAQIMGWHVINNLKTTVGDLRDPNRHLTFAVKLLLLDAKPYLTSAAYNAVTADTNYEKAMRIWNTGSPNGNTYHVSYVADAKKVRDCYQIISAAAPAPIPVVDEPEPTVSENDEQQPPPNNSTETNVAAIPATAEVPEPEPYNNGKGFWATIKGDLVKATGGNLTVEATSQYLQQASGIPEWLIPIIKTVAIGGLIFTAGWFVFRTFHYVVDSWKQSIRTQIIAEAATDPAKANIQFVKQ